MSNNAVNIAIIGLGFGKEFIPIYQAHKNVGDILICTRNPGTLKAIGDEYGIPEDRRFTNWEDLLPIASIDAIHIVTPVLSHAQMAIAALSAGKHAASTIPMATSVEDCTEIVRAKKRSKKVYMMMETAIYTREYLFVKNLVDTGRLGRIQFVRGSHVQDMGMPGWDEYWKGFPPMHNGTHAISPLLSITGKMAESVVCHGSGRLSEDLASRYNSPFAVETATIKMKDSDVVAEATRSLYEVVRQYRESMDVYGDKLSFEWEQIEDKGHVLFTGGEGYEFIDVPDTDALLPEEIKRFTKREQVHDQNHVSFIQGAGHGGSHPHLAHEFVSAIVENRDSAVDAVRAANITSAGICAHTSAMQGGERVFIPDYAAID